jgi:hypothetical protein
VGGWVDRGRAISSGHPFADGERLPGARALHMAATLGIVGLLENAPRSVDELAGTTETHAPTLYRLLADGRSKPSCSSTIGLS